MTHSCPPTPLGMRSRETDWSVITEERHQLCTSHVCATKEQLSSTHQLQIFKSGLQHMLTRKPSEEKENQLFLWTSCLYNILSPEAFHEQQTMASTGLQLLGLVLAVLGWVCGALVCAAPLWRVSAFVGGELVIAQVTWEGLWMNCLSQTTGQIQCKTYDSTLALPVSAQAARGLTVLSLLLCFLALILGVAGAKCTHCMEGGSQASKAWLGRVAGALFLVASLAYLIPICWTAHAIIRDFYDPTVAAPLKRELGPALYLGWVASVLLLVGGSLLYVGSSPPGQRALPVFEGAVKEKPNTGAAGEAKQQEKSFV